jgi:beta-phosphoglucomutase
VYGNEVSKGKPEPEPYIKGIERLNLSSEECIAIENAPLGIASAKSAGLYCIGVCSTMTPEFLHAADELVHDFSGLQSLKAFCVE